MSPRQEILLIIGSVLFVTWVVGLLLARSKIEMVHWGFLILLCDSPLLIGVFIIKAVITDFLPQGPYYDIAAWIAILIPFCFLVVGKYRLAREWEELSYPDKLPYSREFFLVDTTYYQKVISRLGWTPRPRENLLEEEYFSRRN